MTSRRKFLKLTTATAAGLAVSRAWSYAQVLGANDRVRVGIVGFSTRTKDALVPALLQHASALNFSIVAVSDIWSRRRDEGAEFIEKLTGQRVVKTRNNDELYDRKDVDAVIIGTADFQHSLHGVEAVRAGRDAYIEKPLANTMADARAILKAVQETRRIVQIGTQRRSARNHLTAREYLQSGEFGAINMVRMSANVNQPGRWRRPDLVEALRQEDTDWKRFLMNRPSEPWDPRKYIEYRLFWPYSSGIPCQWMVHQIDALHMVTGFDRPRSVIATGGTYQWRDGRENPDTITAVFDYGPPSDLSKGFQLVFSSRMGNSAEGNNDRFYSNGGMFDMATGKVSSEGGLNERYAAEMNMRANLLAGKSIYEKAGQMEMADTKTGVDAAVSAHMRNWMECIRSRKTPNADIKAGYDHSVALCMTIAAQHSGRKATFDEAKQDIAVSTSL